MSILHSAHFQNPTLGSDINSITKNGREGGDPEWVKVLLKIAQSQPKGTDYMLVTIFGGQKPRFPSTAHDPPHMVSVWCQH